MGAIEEIEDALVQKQFDINVFGVLRTIRAFLPGLRAQGAGTIISSVGGLRGSQVTEPIAPPSLRSRA